MILLATGYETSGRAYPPTNDAQWSHLKELSLAERIYIDRPLPPGFDELFGPDWDVFGPDPAQLPTCRAAIAGSSLWGSERIAEGIELEVISRSGIGYDTVDLAAAAAQGVVVCNTPDAPSISTAEHTLSLLMAATKFTANNVARLRQGRIDYYAANEGIELSGATIGVVGHGRIGSRVARIAAAMDMRVIVCDPYVEVADHEQVDMETILAESRVITMHTPLTNETRNMLDVAAFEAMQDGVVIINAARGGVIDTQALIGALDSGKVYAAGLDVTAPEPLEPEHTLLNRDNVIVTPHIASATDKGRKRMYRGAIENARQVLAGTRPVNVVNPDVYDR
jgi:phosphoglycerate dehydrogenase-like enzyme